MEENNSKDDINKKLNDVLREDLLRLERYLEEYSLFLPLAVFSVNPGKMIIDVNNAGEKLSEYDSIEIVGKKITSIFMDSDSAERIFEDLIRQERMEDREMVLITKNEKEIPVRVSTSVRKDEKGNIISSFWALTDISSAKEFQKELESKVKERTKELENSRFALAKTLEEAKRSKEIAEVEKRRTEIVINSLPESIIVLDNNKKIIFFNSEAERFFGTPFKVVEKKEIKNLLDFERFKEMYEAFDQKIDWTGKKHEMVIEKPTKRSFEVLATPMGYGGEVRGLIILLHDITREKELQQMKTEFVSIAAHQLRTPLSAIKWGMDIILHGDAGEIKDEQREILEKTYESNNRMITLIRDLLSVTRIEEGRYLYEAKPEDLTQIVKGVFSSLEEKANLKKIDFNLEIKSRKIPKIKIDTEKIGIAVTNLIDNALNYTQEGGEVGVFLKYKEKEDVVEFCIRDNGIGITEDQKKDVFRKFARGENVKKIETEGTGLGMFITKNIIEAHGGNIWFNSKSDEGTEFYFKIPRDFNKS